MATAILYCSFVLLLYLQGNYAQQGLANNPNAGINNGIGFQQQAQQRTNQNNLNQTPNGGLNINLPQQSNFQQGNLQQPISGNFQGSLQPSLSLQANLQPQGGSGSLGNVQFTKQGVKAQLTPGLVINPPKSQSGSTQTNNGCRQNAQQQNNMGPISNMPTSQAQNAPFSSNSLAEIAALKGHPSLLSLFASQNNIAPPQQNQQMANFNPSQNQLTDVQKQFLVRALQAQTSGQSQSAVNYAQTQLRGGGGVDNRPTITIQGSPVSPQQPQAFVAPMASQPPYITIQAQPLTSYLQNQQPQVVENPSITNLLLSELQPSGNQYNMYPPYQVQKQESKSNLKSLIPLIINLLKEKSSCGCPNCGCPNNGCGNNNVPEPTIFGGYSNQLNYGPSVVEATMKETKAEETKSKSNAKENKKVKKNVVHADSEEGSEENDSEYVDDSEEE